MSCLQATQRPQALPNMRVAPEVDSCGLRMSRLSPPHPPTSKTPPKWGQAGQKQGGAIAKINPRETDTWKKSVDWLTNRAAGHVTLSKSASRISQKIHENTVFIHGLPYFIHGLLFEFFAPIFSISFSFTNERERERGGKQAKTSEKPNPRILSLRVAYPRICYKSRSTFVDFLGGFWQIRGKNGLFVGDFSNPWMPNLYKSMGYSNSSRNPRILQKNKVSPREVGGSALGFTLASKTDAHCAFAVYNRLVTSKTGVIGFCSPMHRCDASRSSPADRAASLSVPPVLAARMGGRKACRFAQAVPGLQTRPSRRLCFAASATVFANRTAWRPNMANTQTRPATPGATSAFSPDFVELLTGIQHDADMTCKALSSIATLLHGCAEDVPLSAGGLYALLEPIASSLDTLCGDLRTLANQPGAPL